MTTIPKITLDLDFIEPKKIKSKPNDDELKFGQDFTDRMLFREYKNGNWQKGKSPGVFSLCFLPQTRTYSHSEGTGACSLPVRPAGPGQGAAGQSRAGIEI